MGISKLKLAILKTNLVSTKNREFSAILYINYNMSPLYGWDPRDTVHHWMSKKKHRESSKEEKERNKVILVEFSLKHLVKTNLSIVTIVAKTLKIKKNFNLLLLLINCNE